MATLSPYHTTFTVDEDMEGLRITIPGQWKWVLLFPVVWLSFWTFAGISAVRSLLLHFTPFLCFWLAGWACGEAFVGYIVLYALAGRQILVASSEAIRLRTEIFRIGWTKSYLVREMRNLRFRPAFGAGKGRVPNGITFEYGGRTVAFASGIEEPEATDLISRIRQRCAIPEGANPQETGIKVWSR